MALPRLQPVPAVCTGPGTVRTRCLPAPRDHSAEPAPVSPLRADRAAGARLCSVWQQASGWLSVPALALPLLTKMSGQKVRCPWSSGPPFSAWRSRGVARLPTPAACVLRPNSPVLPPLVAREAWRRAGRLGGPERPMATMQEGIPLLLTTLRGGARPPGPGSCLLCRRLLRSNPGCSHLRPHPFMSGLLVPGAQRTAQADA